MEENKNKKSKIIKIGLGLVSVIYLSGSIIFSMKTFPNTFVNKENKSFVDKGKVFERNEEEFILTLIGDADKEIEIKNTDIDFLMEVDGNPELKQNPLIWPVALFSKDNYNVEYKTSYSDNKLQDILNKSGIYKDMKKPVNAQIVKKDGVFTIEKEELGNTIDKELLTKKILKAMINKDEKLDLKEAYVKPSITSESKELKNKLDKINEYYLAEFIFDFEDRKEVLTKDELFEMLEETKDGYKMDPKKSRAYIVELGNKYDTYARPRKFNATGIGEITVPGGIYGWQINVDETNKKLINAFKNGETGKVDIVYNHEGNIRSKDDIGDTYVELDLSRQKMWFYKNGELKVETKVVTGTGKSKKSATPTGVGRIWSKEQDRYLNGNDALTNVGYSVPVKYWMPIGWTGAGIHDTYYRKDYGGDIYLNNGSSSCINTPETAVRQIYEQVELNTPVVVYESSTNYSPTEFEKQAMLRGN